MSAPGPSAAQRSTDATVATSSAPAGSARTLTASGPLASGPGPRSARGLLGVTRARDLATRILEVCDAGDGRLDGRLPTERFLAESLGVSRAAVRNALAVLANEGRISREVGRGTFLLAPGATMRDASRAERSGASPDDVSPADVLAARRLIELELVPVVVARATERDLYEIERCALEGERASSVEVFEHWDLEFHHAIVVASHNQLLVRMYEAIEQARRGEIWGNLKRRQDTSARRSQRCLEHRQIVSGLRSRELATALRAVEHHIEQVTRSMLGDVAGSLPVSHPRA